LAESFACILGYLMPLFQVMGLGSEKLYNFYEGVIRFGKKAILD
jgi:hypothetical protein